MRWSEAGLKCLVSSKRVAQIDLRSDGSPDRTIDEQHPILCMGEQSCNIQRVQARIDGVQHRAHAGHGEIKLEVTVRVPGQRGDAFAALDADPGEEVGEPARRPSISA